MSQDADINYNMAINQLVDLYPLIPQSDEWQRARVLNTIKNWCEQNEWRAELLLENYVKLIPPNRKGVDGDMDKAESIHTQ